MTVPSEVPAQAEAASPLPQAWIQRAALPAAPANAKAEVLEALEHVRAAFPDLPVLAWPDGAGGAHVVIDGVPLSSRWRQASTFIAFHLNHMCPDADTYPHYVRSDLAYSDGRALQVPITAGAQFEEAPVLQVSRRTATHDPVTTTPANKTRAVLAWLRDVA